MHAGTCKYFTDEHLFSHCRAGVRYRDVMSVLPHLVGGEALLPCVKTRSQQAVPNFSSLPIANFQGQACCDKYEAPTSEDIAANQAKRAADMKEIRKIFPLIDRVKAAYQGKDWAGQQACPICAQQLFVQHFGATGRTWGKCETPHCIAWLE